MLPAAHTLPSITISGNPGLQDIQPLDMMQKPDNANPEPSNQGESYDCESGGDDNDNADKDYDGNSAVDGAIDDPTSDPNPCSDSPVAPLPGDATIDDDEAVPPADFDGNEAGGEALGIHSKKRRVSSGDGVEGAGVGVTRTKVYSSPDSILVPISPYPSCTIRLNTNDHRFSSIWKPHIQCDEWEDELARKSHSMSFDCKSEQDWRSKLRQVHEKCWIKWELGSHLPDLALANGIAKPVPGTIPEHVFLGLKPIIDSLPPRKVYRKA